MNAVPTAIVLTSSDDAFFSIINGPYLTWRRTGLPVRLEYTGGRWAIVAPQHAVADVLDRIARDIEGRCGTERSSFDEPCREFEALLRLKRGEPLAYIAASMPNLTTHTLGVSEKSAEIIVRGAVRVLLSSVLRDRRPPDLPDELWPPEDVRADLRDGSETRRSKLLRLRAWVQNRTPTREP